MFLSGALATLLAADQTAVVTGDRVNVRGQSSFVGEVITQLRQGEQVTVLGEITHETTRPGEPARWMRIRLPENTPVWVFAPYVDADDSTSRVNRLNLRGGPGENYSILGRIDRGTQVNPIRVVQNWMEIEAPEQAYAYVAADFLEIIPSPTPTEPPTVAEVTPPVDVDEPAPIPVPIDDDPMLVTAPEEITPAIPAVTEEEPAPTELPRRVVAREGRVIISRSIQAPTEYALESLQTRRTINFIHSEDLGVNLRLYAGRKVIVTGEELLDRRWTNTPIIEVESIRLVP